MDRRIDYLVEQDLARRQASAWSSRDLLNTLRRRELDATAASLSAETGLADRPSAEDDHVSSVYRQRITLGSGRFAMIDGGMGFQLVPWRPALQHLGRSIAPSHREPTGVSGEARRGLAASTENNKSREGAYVSIRRAPGLEA